MTAIITRQRAQEVHDMARARAGLPYAYGGAFTRDPRVSTDCSGLVLQTAAWFLGRTDWPGQRYGSTESFRLDHRIVYDLGFKRLPKGGIAALGFTPVMLVGLQHGGGGMYSHTACTLMTMDIPGGPVTVSKRGVDWESHGNVNGVGVSLYDGARAWNDPLFHDFWYLDAKLEGAPASAGDDAADVLARATGLPYEKAERILPQVSAGLIASDCTTVPRIAMWLAQIGHESDSFNATEEYAKNGRYAPYIGRTWIQITWDYNYRAFGKWCVDNGLLVDPEFFSKNPSMLANQEWAGLGPAWYWTTQRKLNELSDAMDLLGATQAINGGTNGIADRQARYNRALAVGDRLLALIANHEQTDELEELMMLEVESTSIYADPGEPKIPVYKLIQALDAHGPHEPYVEAQARLGDRNSVFRVLRTAAGKGKYGNAPGPVRQASIVLNELEASGVLAAYKRETA